MSQGRITGISVAHDHAELDRIEAAGARDVPTRLNALLATDEVYEAFVLETCNRVEAYVVAATAEDGRVALAAEVGAPDPLDGRWLDHDQAIEHLLRIGAGLESMILGEDEILGQLRTARESAETADGLGPVLSEVTEKAIRVGERARTETAINEGALSLARAAAELAAERRALAGQTVGVVGAGEMGTTVARAMADTAVDRVIVCNRTPARADSVADHLDVETDACGLDELPRAVAAADVVVTATGSSDHVLDSETFTGAGDTLVIDIAQPRDVAPTVRERPEITLLDLDALHSRMDATEAKRVEAAREVESIVETERERLEAQLKRKQADAVISLMYEGATAIKDRQVETACAKLERTGELTDADREVIEAMADAIVHQIMAAPTKSLREAAEREQWETLQTALQLFDPNFESGAVSTDEQPDPTATSGIRDNV